MGVWEPLLESNNNVIITSNGQKRLPMCFSHFFQNFIFQNLATSIECDNLVARTSSWVVSPWDICVPEACKLRTRFGSICEQFQTRCLHAPRVTIHRQRRSSVGQETPRRSCCAHVRRVLSLPASGTHSSQVHTTRVELLATKWSQMVAQYTFA